MKKGIIAAICIMLVSVMIFAGCTKHRYYVDELGNKHIAVTDEAGETVTNEDGQIVIAAVDEKGKVIINDAGETETRSMDLPGVILLENGKKISVPYFMITVPDGWHVGDTSTFAQILNEDESIRIDFETGTDTTIDMIVDGYLALSESLKQLDNSSYEMTMNKIKLDIQGNNLDTTYVTITGDAKDSNGNDHPAYLGAYMFNYKGVVYRISYASQEKEAFESADIIPIIQLIEFKNYEPITQSTATEDGELVEGPEEVSEGESVTEPVVVDADNAVSEAETESVTEASTEG